jgi:hypothetical protein
MAEGVACDPPGLPPAVEFSLGGQAGVKQGVVEEAVGLDRKEVVRIALHGPPEGAVKQADIAQGKGSGSRNRD